MTVFSYHYTQIILYDFQNKIENMETKKCSCFSTRTQELRMSMKLRMLKNSRLERITQNTKVRGNTSPNLPLAGECPLVLGRYDVLFSTASRPFRLSALQNACVYRHLGHILSYFYAYSCYICFPVV